MPRKQLLLALISAALIGGLAGGGVVAWMGNAFNQDTGISFKVPPANQAVKGAGLSPAQIYQLDSAGTVYIQAQNSSTSGDAGSGVVLNRQGYILTNDHVVSRASFVTVTFANKKQVVARVVGADPSNDLAVLKINASYLLLHPLPLGDSQTVSVGESVVALGAPFGLTQSLTSGVISSAGRTITAPDGFPIVNVLQTDAPINPGNSGGPLIDGYGRVVGINAQIESSSNSSSGVGFAIPINTVKTLLPGLMHGKSPKRSWMGIEGGDVSALPPQAGLTVQSGAYVSKVIPGGPAAKAGIRGGLPIKNLPGVSLGGDVIVSIDGKAIADFSQLVTATSSKPPGAKMQVGIVRGHQHLTLTLTLGVQPAKAGNQASGGGTAPALP